VGGGILNFQKGAEKRVDTMKEKKTILIVDDSKTVRNLVSFVVKKAGFKVVTAE